MYENSWLNNYLVNKRVTTQQVSINPLYFLYFKIKSHHAIRRMVFATEIVLTRAKYSLFVVVCTVFVNDFLSQRPPLLRSVKLVAIDALLHCTLHATGAF